MSIIRFNHKASYKTYLYVSVLGNSLKLNIKYTNNSTIELNKTNTQIDLFLPKKYKSVDNMNVINLAIQKLYNQIADTEIEYAMEIARHILKFAPEDYSIKRMDNAFYKCSKNKITINPDIVKYNKEIINTTILEAFCKIKYRPNSMAYKNLLTYALNQYEIHKNKNNSQLRILKIS